VAGNISGLYVGVTAAGAVLVWSGWKGATLAATFGSLIRGNLNAPDTESVSAVADATTAPADASSGGASQNYLTIGQFLVANGYTPIGAAGIVGCVAGESSGNPEAVGAGSYGIIQEQGSQYASLVTGNADKDLDAQLQALLVYNNAQGAGLITMLNAQSTPVAAADFYSQQFERPAVTDSDVVASVANQVYAELTASTTGGLSSAAGQTAITGSDPSLLAP
jgi:Phage tail lysozyme